MTRTVKDAALMMNACAGPDERDQYSLPAAGVDYVKALKGNLQGLRVAWSATLGVAPAVDPEVREATAKAARAFRELGCRVESVEPKWPSPYDCWRAIFLGGIAVRLAPYLDRRDQIDPGLLPIVEEATKYPPTKYVEAWFERLAWWQHARAFFERYDLLLTPTVACPPLPIGAFYATEIGGAKVGRDAVAGFAGRRGARFDVEPALAKHFVVQLTPGRARRPDRVDVRAGRQPRALQHRRLGRRRDHDDVGAAHRFLRRGRGVHAELRGEGAGVSRAPHADLAQLPHESHRLEVTPRLDARAQDPQHRRIRARQVLSGDRRHRRSAHLGDEPPVHRDERLARVGPEEQDRGVV